MRKNQSADLRKPEILESYYQVLIEEGLEGTSISKIASRIGIHPSLIIHYFKNKENMKLELVDLLIEKYQSPAMINFDHIEDDEEHFNAIIDVIFSFKWNRTVDPGGGASGSGVGGDSWRGNWTGSITAGPGALGTSRVVGGSGIFAGLETDGVESLSAKAYSVAEGPVAVEGELTIELPRLDATIPPGP